MEWRSYKNHRTVLNSQVGQGKKKFDPAHWMAEIRNLLEELRQQDPLGGCWDWVETNRADKWRLLMAAMKRIDTAFEGQCPGDLAQAITSARKLYLECVKDWGTENKPNISQH